MASAHVAPTAVNLQPVKLSVVQDKERINSVAKAGNIYDGVLTILFMQIIQKPGHDFLIANNRY